MIVEAPFEKEFLDRYTSNIITSYELDYLSHKDKNTREGNLISEALGIYLESKVGKQLLPIENILWDCSERYSREVYKHQVLAVMNLNIENKECGLGDLYVYDGKGDAYIHYINSEDKLALSMIFNFTYKYYTE